MVERNELITVFRQIGGMMEAGVDILRITRVLRAQTENARLLQLYEALDHDMTMGHSLADAMSRAPDVFSPFMVLMVQQGEARNDLAGAFFKIADYLQKDAELTPDSSSRNDVSHSENANAESADFAPQQAATAQDRVLDSAVNAPTIPPTAPMTVIALDGLIDRLQTFALRSLTVVSGLLLSLAGVWWSAEMGWLERRWLNVTAFSVAAIFMGASGIFIQRRIQAERRREARCSFCGKPGTEGDELQSAPRFAGAAICSRCAAIVAHNHEVPSEEKVKISSLRNSIEHDESAKTVAARTTTQTSPDGVHNRDDENKISQQNNSNHAASQIPNSRVEMEARDGAANETSSRNENGVRESEFRDSSNEFSVAAKSEILEDESENAPLSSTRFSRAATQKRERETLENALNIDAPPLDLSAKPARPANLASPVAMNDGEEDFE